MSISTVSFFVSQSQELSETVKREFGSFCCKGRFRLEKKLIV